MNGYRVILHDTDPDGSRHAFRLHEVLTDNRGMVVCWSPEPCRFGVGHEHGHRAVLVELASALNDCLGNPVLRLSDLEAGRP